MPNQLVAVYGSLRKGLSNHGRLAGLECQSVEKIEGFTMYAVCAGYPALFENGSEEQTESVIEVYDVDEDVMASLDALEGYPRYYNRKKVETSLGEAWIYFLEDSTYERSRFPVVESGDWVEYKNKLDKEYLASLNAIRNA